MEQLISSASDFFEEFAQVFQFNHRAKRNKSLQFRIIIRDFAAAIILPLSGS